eukprot:jgi/Bigna1/71663/fgenesh1_pg.16_\
MEAKPARRLVELEIKEHRTALGKRRDVIVNRDYLSGVKVGDILEISSSGSLRRSYPGEQIPSLYVRVYVSILEKDSDAADLDFVEVIPYPFLYLNRSSALQRPVHWKGQKLQLIAALQGQMVHKGKLIECQGMRTKVMLLMKQQQRTMSGRVTHKTKVQFRSRSARLFWLIQISAEMWDCADDGEQYYEKMIVFLKVLLDKWRAAGVSHALSVVLFGRTIYEIEGAYRGQWGPPLAPESQPKGDRELVSPEHVVSEDQFGNLFKDHYRVILERNMDGNPKDIKSALKLIRQTILDWPKSLKWGESDAHTGLVGGPSTADKGNVVESVNLVLAEFERHYFNRALKRTGQNIMVLTAGTGQFYVDRELTQLTDVRMDDNGIIVDIVSVARPPLYRCVLFLTTRNTNEPASLSSSSSSQHPHQQYPQTPGFSSSNSSRQQQQQQSPSSVAAAAANSSGVTSPAQSDIYNQLRQPYQQQQQHQQQLSAANSSTVASRYGSLA